MEPQASSCSLMLGSPMQEFWHFMELCAAVRAGCATTMRDWESCGLRCARRNDDQRCRGRMTSRYNGHCGNRRSQLELRRLCAPRCLPGPPHRGRGVGSGAVTARTDPDRTHPTIAFRPASGTKNLYRIYDIDTGACGLEPGSRSFSTITAHGSAERNSANFA